ncbi:TPA: hypothetical protein JG906_001919 [Enterobacter hormaechei subsp. steigerwaltii]|nr:hypothetical protein [Enterobacter hormaechei subsp. steigerwaltii]
MSELTKKWLQQTIAELEEERDAVPGVVNEDAAMALAAMKLALASLEANGAIANEGTITATQFKPVADLYGLTSPTGGETSFTFDAVEARDFIDGGWSCQEYVELGRFQEAMLQNGNSPAQSDCCPEQNYIAPAQDGDSPVIPDGWVMVPIEPIAEMISSGIAAHFERSQTQIHDRPAPGPMECAYVAMLAAAPQKEVK